MAQLRFVPISIPREAPSKAGGFRATDLWVSLFDLCFLLPVVWLMVGSERGAGTYAVGRDLLYLGIAWLLSAVLFRTPLPLQPLKVWAFLFLILHPTPQVVSLSAILLGVLLFAAGQSGFSRFMGERLDEASFERIRRWVGLYVRGVALLSFAAVAFRALSALPAGSLLPGFLRDPLALGPGTLLSVLLLVLPQLPVTLANGILATVRERRSSGALSQAGEMRLTDTSLSRWLGLADLLAGLLGVLPFCHGSGGLWAYRRHNVRSLLPSFVSSGLLILLGFRLLSTSLPLPGPLLPGLFLAGFLLVESRLKKRAPRPACGSLPGSSPTNPIEIWILSGGLLSSAIVLGGIPLVLLLLVGIRTAMADSPGQEPGHLAVSPKLSLAHLDLSLPTPPALLTLSSGDSRIIEKSGEASSSISCDPGRRLKKAGDGSGGEELPNLPDPLVRRPRGDQGPLFLFAALLVLFRIVFPRPLRREFPDSSLPRPDGGFSPLFPARAP